MLATTLLPLLGALIATTAAAPATTFKDLVSRLQQRDVDPSTLATVVPEGEVFDSSYALWANETQRWSTYKQPTFDLLFIPETENDISQALAYMSSNGIPYFTQGGGHGYSATLEVKQNVVMINMQNFGTITWNDDDSVTLGGQVHFGDLGPALYERGRELTIGSCVCVGATGAYLGGGHGRLQGKHGLTSDALQSIRMVLYDGTIVDVNSSSNADLFWAMRGAGQNFGVVISSTFTTYPQENGGMHYNADMSFTSDSLRGVVEVINSIIPGQAAGLAIDFLVFADPTTLTPIVYVNLVYAGPEAEGKAYTALFASSASINRTSLAESVVPFADLDDTAAQGAITAACTKGSKQNTYTANLATLDLDTIQSLYDGYAELIAANPAAAGSLLLFEIFGTQAVAAAADDFTAYPGRGKDSVLALIEMIYSDDSVADTVDAFAKQWRDALAVPAVSGYDKLYVYQNYAHGDEPLAALYGYDVWRQVKLTAVKNKYDPLDNFNGFHNLPLDGVW